MGVGGGLVGGGGGETIVVYVCWSMLEGWRDGRLLGCVGVSVLCVFVQGLLKGLL